MKTRVCRTCGEIFRAETFYRKICDKCKKKSRGIATLKAREIARKKVEKNAKNKEMSSM